MVHPPAPGPVRLCGLHPGDRHRRREAEALQGQHHRRRRHLPYSLYDEEIATFDEDEVYNQADSAGFINLFGLPIAERAKLAKNWPGEE